MKRYLFYLGHNEGLYGRLAKHDAWFESKMIRKRRIAGSCDKLDIGSCVEGQRYEQA